MSKPTLKMTHGAIGEAMCCYTNGSYKDAEIALIEYENSIRADEQTTVLKDLYASDKSSTLKELLNIARAEARTEFAEWLEENSYKYIESFWQGHSIGEALEDFEKEKKNEI